MRKRWHKLAPALGALMVAALACRPVVTVGWTEIIILAAIIVFAISPFLIRVFRWYVRWEEKQDEE